MLFRSLARLERHITGIATKRHPSTRVFGSPVVLDDWRSRKQAARFQDLLQQPSRAYLTRRANVQYTGVTTNRKSPLVSMATSLSRPISDTAGCLNRQRLALAPILGQPRQNFQEITRSFSIAAKLRGSHRFTATGCVPRVRLSLLSQLRSTITGEIALSTNNSRETGSAWNSPGLLSRGIAA